jgi:hypothetical protein
MELPYVGYLSCRPFCRGGDVVDTMALMGVAGSLTGASRLLVVWEHQDLCVALQRRGAEAEPNGQVVVEAVLDRGMCCGGTRSGCTWAHRARSGGPR